MLHFGALCVSIGYDDWKEVFFGYGTVLDEKKKRCG